MRDEEKMDSMRRKECKHAAQTQSKACVQRSETTSLRPSNDHVTTVERMSNELAKR